MSKRLRQLSDHDLLVAGFTAAKTHHHPRAIEHFQEARRRDPADPFVLIELAKSHHALQQAEPCLACLNRVAELAKQDPQLLLPLSEAYQQVRATDAACATAAQAEQHPPLRSAALLRQAELLEKTNDLDAAEDALKRAADQTTSPLLPALRAKLLRRRGETDAARALLEQLLTDESALGPQLASHLRYELASAYDKLGRPDAAMQALEQAKAFHTGGDEYRVAERGRRSALEHLRGASSEITVDDCAAWAQSPALADLDGHDAPPAAAFLLGHPRSGTTLIEQALDAHPDLASADELLMFHSHVWAPLARERQQGQPVGLADQLRGLPAQRIAQARAAYRDAWTRAAPDTPHRRVRLDKNPALTTHLPAIARFFPDAPIVFALRDPRDVVLSAYMQPVGLNDWSINWLTLQDTVDYYCFAMQMWLDLRGKLPNPSLEVRYEDTVADLPAQARRATEFLGLDWHDGQADIRRHVRTKTVHSPTYGDVSEPVYRRAVGRWERYADFLSPFEKQLAPFAQALGYL